jgi:predicted RNA-binding protein with PUA-like domain
MRYWLFKSEPSCFSFSDLQTRPYATEHWDGVRNYQARNFLRDEIKVGDQVLFYHSSIPEPCVVGLCRVTKAGYPDHTACDPASDHFDPKASPSNPIWYMVDLQATAPISPPVTLATIRMHPALQQMPLLNRSRLSIQPLSQTEFQIIMEMGGIKCSAN